MNVRAAPEKRSTACHGHGTRPERPNQYQDQGNNDQGEHDDHWRFHKSDPCPKEPARYYSRMLKAPALAGGELVALAASNATGTSPENCSSCAAACERSITRFLTKGPRSLMRTTVVWPLAKLVTRTVVPKGRVRCAAVSLASD